MGGVSQLTFFWRQVDGWFWFGRPFIHSHWRGAHSVVLSMSITRTQVLYVYSSTYRAVVDRNPTGNESKQQSCAKECTNPHPPVSHTIVVLSMEQRSECMRGAEHLGIQYYTKRWSPSLWVCWQSVPIQLVCLFACCFLSFPLSFVSLFVCVSSTGRNCGFSVFVVFCHCF